MLLDRNFVIADADSDCGLLSPFLVEPIAQENGGDSKHTDDQKKDIAVQHGLVAAVSAVIAFAIFAADRIAAIEVFVSEMMGVVASIVVLAV